MPTRNLFHILLFGFMFCYLMTCPHVRHICDGHIDNSVITGITQKLTKRDVSQTAEPRLFHPPQNAPGAAVAAASGPAAHAPRLLPHTAVSLSIISSARLLL